MGDGSWRCRSVTVPPELDGVVSVSPRDPVGMRAVLEELLADGAKASRDDTR